MSAVVPARHKLSTALLVTAAASLALVAFGLFYLSRPAAPANSEAAASQEAKAYVHNLQLSDVTMQATENFMQQQVVEVQGKIANQGSRSLRSVDVFCLFQNVGGQEIGRERLPIVPVSGRPIGPGEVRSFRLPFDQVPEGWNQAMPRMVIARIAFLD